MEHILQADDFVLRINTKIFEADISYPTNTILEVNVQSDGFSANTTMDIDIREFAKFAHDLVQMYETLSGKAEIQEPYGMKMFIKFSGDGSGHIAVNGYLHKGNRAGNEQSLTFQNEFDQTYLS